MKEIILLDYNKIKGNKVEIYIIKDEKKIKAYSIVTEENTIHFNPQKAIDSFQIHLEGFITRVFNMGAKSKTQEREILKELSKIVTESFNILRINDKQ